MTKKMKPLTEAEKRMADVVLTAAQKQKLKRAVTVLNDVRRELQQENPEYDINWYLEGDDNLNLMKGESHDGNGVAQMDNVIETFCLNNASGGGW